MRRLASFLAFLTATAMLANVNPMPAAADGSTRLATQCPAGNASADTTMRGLKESLASNYAGDSSWRVALQLVGVDSSAVRAITDSLICTRVTRVLDSITGTAPNAPGAYFVVRVASRYIAFPNLLVPRSQNLWILDTNFVFLGVTVF